MRPLDAMETQVTRCRRHFGAGAVVQIPRQGPSASAAHAGACGSGSVSANLAGAGDHLRLGFGRVTPPRRQTGTSTSRFRLGDSTDDVPLTRLPRLSAVRCIVAAMRGVASTVRAPRRPGTVRSGTVSIVSTGPRSLVKVRCGVPSCRRLLARVVAIGDGQSGIVLSADAAEGAQWLADSGRSARSGPVFTVPAEGVVPVAPCPRHTQWATDQHGLRRGSDRNISETAERTGTSITVMRTAYVDAARLVDAVGHAARTGREGRCWSCWGSILRPDVLVPRRELRQDRTG